jgi:hypothetical protein
LFIGDFDGRDVHMEDVISTGLLLSNLFVENGVIAYGEKEAVG